MKRSDFLKRLGIGLGAVVVAPRVLAEMPAKEKPAFNTDLINKRIREYPLTKDECYLDVNWYCLGDAFVNDKGDKYICVKKDILPDGVAILTLCPINSAPSVVVSNITLRNHFHPTGGSVLLKYND